MLIACLFPVKIDVVMVFGDNSAATFNFASVFPVAAALTTVVGNALFKILALLLVLLSVDGRGCVSRA